MTSFEDSHYILLFRYIYGAQLISGFAIQNTFISTVVITNQICEVLQRHYLVPKCYSANVTLDFCTTTDFETKYFVNEDDAGVLGNTYLIFLSFADKMTISTQK